MNDFISLSCPSCGGQLEIMDDIEQFKCTYCGTEHAVRRGRGVIALKPLVEGLKRVEVATDRTASELAIARLMPEIEALEYEISETINQMLTFDVGNICSALYAMKLIGFSFGDDGSTKRRKARVVLMPMSAKEFHRFIDMYQTNTDSIFKRGKAKKVIPVLEKIRNSKEQLENKMQQLRKHQSIVDS